MKASSLFDDQFERAIEKLCDDFRIDKTEIDLTELSCDDVTYIREAGWRCVYWRLRECASKDVFDRTLSDVFHEEGKSFTEVVDVTQVAIIALQKLCKDGRIASPFEIEFRESCQRDIRNAVAKKLRQIILRHKQSSKQEVVDEDRDSATEVTTRDQAINELGCINLHDPERIAIVKKTLIAKYGELPDVWNPPLEYLENVPNCTPKDSESICNATVWPGIAEIDYACTKYEVEVTVSNKLREPNQDDLEHLREAVYQSIFHQLFEKQFDAYYFAILNRATKRCRLFHANVPYIGPDEIGAETAAKHLTNLRRSGRAAAPRKREWWKLIDSSISNIKEDMRKKMMGNRANSETIQLGQKEIDRLAINAKVFPVCELWEVILYTAKKLLTDDEIQLVKWRIQDYTFREIADRMGFESGSDADRKRQCDTLAARHRRALEKLRGPLTADLDR